MSVLTVGYISYSAITVVYCLQSVLTILNCLGCNILGEHCSFTAFLGVQWNNCYCFCFVVRQKIKVKILNSMMHLPTLKFPSESKKLQLLKIQKTLFFPQQKSRQPCYAQPIQAKLIPDCKKTFLHCFT